MSLKHILLQNVSLGFDRFGRAVWSRPSGLRDELTDALSGISVSLDPRLATQCPCSNINTDSNIGLKGPQQYSPGQFAAPTWIVIPFSMDREINTDCGNAYGWQSRTADKEDK